MKSFRLSVIVAVLALLGLGCGGLSHDPVGPEFGKATTTADVAITKCRGLTCTMTANLPANLSLVSWSVNRCCTSGTNEFIAQWTSGTSTTTTFTFPSSGYYEVIATGYYPDDVYIQLFTEFFLPGKK